MPRGEDGVVSNIVGSVDLQDIIDGTVAYERNKKSRLLPHKPLHPARFLRPLEAPVEENVTRYEIDS